jgi:hypothetical protein
MANIGAPAAPSPPFYVGYGWTDGDNDTIVIFNHTSMPGDVPSEYNTPPFTIYNPTTLFDVSGLPYQRETVCVLYKEVGSIISTLTCSVSWYRTRDNYCLDTFGPWSFTPPSGTSYSSISVVSWLGRFAKDISFNGHDEIVENGDYYVLWNVSGAVTRRNARTNFAVKGIPAWLRLENATASGFNWSAYVSDYFDSSNYIQVGICTQPFTNGQSSAPGGIISYVNAPSSNNSCVIEGLVTWLDSGTTYTVYGYARANNGNYYTCGSASITTINTRPSNWTWTTAELNAFNNHGSLTTLTYSRWNAFLDRIMAFEVYKYGSALTTFNKMTSSDKTLTAARFNQARFAIGSMYSTGITNKSSGDQVLGSYFITMANSLNSITK